MTQLFFRDALSTFPPAANAWSRGEQYNNLVPAADDWNCGAMTTGRGSAAINYGVSTVDGPTNGVEVSFGTPIMWMTPPLAADVTIAGSITFNLRAGESSMNANAAINCRVFRLQPDGTRTEILKTTRTTELGTSEAAANFAQTPTSTNFLRGDRLVFIVFADDAGTMGGGQQVQFYVNGPTAGASGDSYVTTTETLSFESAPAGTTIYLTATASDVATAAIDREAWTSRGAGIQTDQVSSVAGWTAPIQLTNTTGGTVVDWWTKPLVGFTLVGPVLVNLWFRIGGSGSKIATGVEIAVTDNDGSNPVVWARAAWPQEGSNVQTAYQWWVEGYSVAVATGKRLRIRVYIDDAAGDDTGNQAMVAGDFASVNYAATSGGATGDTYLTFSQTLSEAPTFDPATQGAGIWQPESYDLQVAE